MKPRRVLLGVTIALVAPLLLAAVLIALFGWNWLRAPIERKVLDASGRELVIGGELSVRLGWPLLHMDAGTVTFANPAWAQKRQMLTADEVHLAVDVWQLVLRQIVLPQVRLVHPVVFLEQGQGGRKTWLLDRQQRDEDARIRIGLLAIDKGTLGYDDVSQHTSILAELSTTDAPSPGAASGALQFKLRGTYKGLAADALGTGGPVLALRDETTPYPLRFEASLGRTRVRADGTVTSLLAVSALDMQLALQGRSLDDLFPVLGMALPATRAYSTKGRLVHSPGLWRYDRFSGRVGDSDIAGTLTVDSSGGKPQLRAELVSKVLDLADLGPMIGARAGSVDRAKLATAPSGARLLPDLPFNAERWGSVDADVRLKADSIRRAQALPLERLQTHLMLRDSVLQLDPLEFGLAGGILKGAVTLDGRTSPIRAHARIGARKVMVARLFPTVDLSKASVGQVNGDLDLSGQGNSVGAMLATADGNLGLVVAGGEISKLMMEMAGLHLWEILQLNLTGDRLVKLRCAVADFHVTRGTMQVDSLVLDTAVTTITGSGSVDLGKETLDLTLNQKTKNTSPLALRSPIHVGGSFAKPDVSVDKVRVAARALGAVALGFVNPLLALLPLVDTGPGQDSDCRVLVREARQMTPAGKSSVVPTR